MSERHEWETVNKLHGEYTCARCQMRKRRDPRSRSGRQTQRHYYSAPWLLGRMGAPRNVLAPETNAGVRVGVPPCPGHPCCGEYGTGSGHHCHECKHAPADERVA